MNEPIDMKKLIHRINELAAKKKSGISLTAKEIKEKEGLYKTYLGLIRGNIANQLNNIEVIEEDPTHPGNYKTLWQGKNVKNDKS